MSERDVDDGFWDRADGLINLANEYCDTISRSKVSASFLYAAARFNSFVIAASTSSVEELKRDKEDAIEYFVEQYRKMLTENIDDHIKNYDKYIGRGNS
ncbi:MAG: DUF3144 domain-containing protein [Pseudomonadota bacterium]|nr:DUF3144 domain-containing protein [Pseudomonadota bacterium]